MAYLRHQLEELVKLGPTTTNDQDDNERLVGYLTCEPGSKEEQVNSFVNMVHEAN
jgi:hypothetical protein